jgi:L-amino acid N-acyltransferase YncA
VTEVDGITIRLGSPADAAGMAALLNGVIAEGSPVLLTGGFTDEAERAFLEEMPARGGFHVAEAGGGDGHAAPVIVAAQVFVPYAPGMPAHDHVAEMGTWVCAGWRRRGVAGSLWEHTLAALRSRRFSKVFTDIRADNLDSLAYHLAIGFTVAGTARGQAVMDGRTYDVVMVERFL